MPIRGWTRTVGAAQCLAKSGSALAKPSNSAQADGGGAAAYRRFDEPGNSAAETATNGRGFDHAIYAGRYVA
jgi:hypothetical protein